MLHANYASLVSFSRYLHGWSDVTANDRKQSFSSNIAEITAHCRRTRDILLVTGAAFLKILALGT